MLEALENLRTEYTPNHSFFSALNGRFTSSQIVESSLLYVLLGKQYPSQAEPVADIEFFDNHLNAYQKEAVEFSLGSPEIALIHGPPGKR